MTAVTDGFLLGVDLGTSHTVAMLRRPDGRTRPLLFDGRPLLPSAVYLDTTGRLHVGADAVRLGHAEPGRLEPHPKRHIDDDAVLLGDGVSVPVADLLAALLGAVAQEAVATAGFLPPATVTYPASWGAPRRAVLVEALGRAGWPAETALMPEPVAAARYFAEVLRRPLPVGSSLAVFDFGAGTLDIAVVRHDALGAAYSVTASGGADDLGGLDLDSALVDHLGKSLAGAEPAVWQTLTEPVTLGQWRARRQFWEDVRGAKEMLSRSSFAPVPVPGVEHAVHLTRDELEATADPLVRRGVAEAAAVIAAAGLKPSDLAGLFLVGGSSRVPLVARLLHSELGIAPTALEQPELPVAEGATIAPATDSTPVLPPAAAGPPSPPTAPHQPTAAQSPPAPGPPSPPGVPRSSAPSEGPGFGNVPAPTDDRQYADPVDPWATGEAAALANGGHAPPGSPAHPGSPSYSRTQAHPHTPTPFGPPSAEPWLASDTPRPETPAPAKPRRSRRPWIIAGAAATALVVAAGATVAWAFWPKYPALEFHALSDPVHVAPAIPISSDWKGAAVRGDRAYLASSDSKTGKVGLVAIDTDATKPTWTNPDAGTAKRWRGILALPDGVALLSDVDYDTDSRQMVVLGAAKGQKLWERTLGDTDEVHFAGNRAVVSDRTGKQLLGLDLATGKEEWKLPDPGQGAPLLREVTTPADLSGPADVEGSPFAPDLGDDPRLVQVGSDRSVRVIDANSGDVLASRANLADTSDDVIAHNGRLVVRESDGAHRIVTFGLDKLDGDDIVYRTQSDTARLTGLTACGDNRVCVLEGLSGGKNEVVAVDVAEGKQAWRADAGDTNALVPVGEAVLANYSTNARLIGADGTEIWAHQAPAVRLDAGNILELNKPLAGYADDPALAGRHLGDDAVQLGPLSGAVTANCSLSTSYLACPTDKDFVLVKFAG